MIHDFKTSLGYQQSSTKKKLRYFEKLPLHNIFYKIKSDNALN